MAGISDKAMKSNYAQNKYRSRKQEFQNKEFSDGSGLEMYEFKYRMDDPQIGRFWSVDLLADKSVYNSPYAFSENKLTGHIELEGLEAVDIKKSFNLYIEPLCIQMYKKM
jgi:RHS repeat-associated protein